jgi:hypothetical protein
MASRTACPSCRHRLSPLAIECPVCGIPVSRPRARKPLLFQVSREGGHPGRPAGQGAGRGAPKSISSPALGRIAPIDTGGGEFDPPSLKVRRLEDDAPDAPGAPAAATDADRPAGQSIFWRLALMEFHEAAFLLAINGLVAFVACWQLKMPFRQAYPSFWPHFAAMHSIVSWAYLLLPMLLTGSTASMLRHGFGIADTQMEKRISFSLFMLLSVALLPLSFLCMVLTPAHTTLAELLTGQEIRERTPDYMRKR